MLVIIEVASIHTLRQCWLQSQEAREPIVKKGFRSLQGLYNAYKGGSLRLYTRYVRLL